MSHILNNFGNMHVLGLTAAISAINTWTPMPTGFTSNVLNGFTFANGNTLVCQGAGTFLLIATAALSCPLMANQTVSLTYTINGVPAPGVSTQESLPTKALPSSVMVVDIITLNLGDVVGIAVQNNTAISNLNVVSASLSIARLQR